MPHILYVDDDRASRDILTRLLTHHNMAVDVAESATEALQRATGNCYDLIVIDLRLPDLDGWELLRKLQDRVSGTWKAVVLTGYYDASVARQARHVGFVDCLPKPATTATADKIRSILAG